MLLNDRTETDTFGCRLSPKLYRREAGGAVRKASDNPMHKAALSGREKDGFTNDSSISDTHNPIYRRI